MILASLVTGNGRVEEVARFQPLWQGSDFDCLTSRIVLFYGSFLGSSTDPLLNTQMERKNATLAAPVP